MYSIKKESFNSFMTNKFRRVLIYQVWYVLEKYLGLIDFSPIADKSALDYRYLLSNLNALHYDFVSRKESEKKKNDEKKK